MSNLYNIFFKLVLFCILSAPYASAADIPCAFGDDGIEPVDYSATINDSTSTEEPVQLGSKFLDPNENVPLISQYNGSDITNIPTGSSGSGNVQSSSRKEISFQEIQEELNSKVDVDNEITRNSAVIMAAKCPGEYNIEQISFVYHYLKTGWHYVSDPRGMDYYSSASNTLKLGEQLGCIGAGDCDDFAILMSAMIEDIGGWTRIILAYDNGTGHAYTEVYLGNLIDSKSDVTDLIYWLKTKYDVETISTHINPESKEVWLNLDWSAEHPGGPIYNASKSYIVKIRDSYSHAVPTLPPGFNVLKSSTNDETYGLINGKVLSHENEPIISQVIFEDENDHKRLVMTDGSGCFTVQLPAGNYRITAFRTNYDFQQISTDVEIGLKKNVFIYGFPVYVVTTGFTFND